MIRYLLGIGPVLDRPGAYLRIYRNRFLRLMFMRLGRIKFTPEIFERVRELNLPLDERGQMFSELMNHVRVGGTYKTTGLSRTRLADEVLRELAGKFDTVKLMDVGVSDGMSGLDLIERVDNLEEAVLADRFPYFMGCRSGIITRYLDAESRLWATKFGFLAARGRAEKIVCDTPRKIDLTNPVLVERHGIRVRKFDVFQSLLDEPVQLIKCANLLNTEYFSDDMIRVGAENLLSNLTDPGYLVISQNNARYADGEAYFVIEKSGGDLRIVKEEHKHDALEIVREAL